MTRRRRENQDQRDLERFRELWRKLAPEDRVVARGAFQLLIEGRTAEAKGLVGLEGHHESR